MNEKRKLFLEIKEQSVLTEKNDNDIIKLTANEQSVRLLEMTEKYNECEETVRTLQKMNRELLEFKKVLERTLCDESQQTMQLQINLQKSEIYLRTVIEDKNILEFDLIQLKTEQINHNKIITEYNNYKSDFFEKENKYKDDHFNLINQNKEYSSALLDKEEEIKIFKSKIKDEILQKEKDLFDIMKMNQNLNGEVNSLKALLDFNKLETENMIINTKSEIKFQIDVEIEKRDKLQSLYEKERVIEREAYSLRVNELNGMIAERDIEREAYSLRENELNGMIAERDIEREAYSLRENELNTKIRSLVIDVEVAVDAFSNLSYKHKALADELQVYKDRLTSLPIEYESKIADITERYEETKEFTARTTQLNKELSSSLTVAREAYTVAEKEISQILVLNKELTSKVNITSSATYKTENLLINERNKNHEQCEENSILQFNLNRFENNFKLIEKELEKKEMTILEQTIILQKQTEEIASFDSIKSQSNLSNIKYDEMCAKVFNIQIINEKLEKQLIVSQEEIEKKKISENIFELSVQDLRGQLVEYENICLNLQNKLNENIKINESMELIATKNQNLLSNAILEKENMMINHNLNIDNFIEEKDTIISKLNLSYESLRNYEEMIRGLKNHLSDARAVIKEFRLKFEEIEKTEEIEKMKNDNNQKNLMKTREENYEIESGRILEMRCELAAVESEAKITINHLSNQIDMINNTNNNLKIENINLLDNITNYENIINTTNTSSDYLQNELYALKSSLEQSKQENLLLNEQRNSFLSILKSQENALHTSETRERENSEQKSKLQDQILKVRIRYKLL